MSKIHYYFPIDSSNLDYYYNSGILMPAKYLDNRIQDLQNLNKNVLILSSDKFASNSNCSLEVILNQDDVLSLDRVSESIFFYKRPLPVSRVRRIYFQTEDQKLTTIQGISNGEAFVPDEIIEIDSVSQNVEVPTSLSAISNEKYVLDFKAELEIFDRYLGGVALLSSQKNEFNEHNLEYFKLLSNVNSVIKDELLVGLGLEDDDLRLPYDRIFFETEKVNPLYQHITEKLNSKAAENFILTDPKNSGIKVNENQNYNLKELTKVTSQLFVAIFNSYGKYYGLNRRDSLDSFINHLNFGYIKNNFSAKANVIAYYFGMNKGYSSFRNSYKISGQTIDVKFALNSKLDYYIIESIYQYSFFKKRTSSFPLIDSIFISEDPQKPSDYESYIVLDKVFRIRKKKRILGRYVSLQNLSKSSFFSEIADVIQQEIAFSIPNYIPNRKSLIASRFKEVFDDKLVSYSENLIDFINKQMGRDREVDELKNEIAELRKLLVVDQTQSFSKKEITEDIEDLNNATNLLLEAKQRLLEESEQLKTAFNELVLDKKNIEINLNKLENQIDSYDGDFEDPEYLGSKVYAKDLKKQMLHLEDKMILLEGSIYDNEQSIFETERQINETERVKKSDLKSSDLGSKATKEKNKSIMKSKDEANLFTNEQLNVDSINIDTYKEKFQEHTHSEINLTELVNFGNSLGLVLKGKKKNVVIAKINERLNLR
jgi:hypothetical protein